MAEATEDIGDIEKLYEYGERLNEAKDKSQNRKDYEGILAAANGSVKAKQLSAQMIPKFFKYFPELAEQALDQHLYLCEDEELGVRVQAIRGLPLFCKDTPEHLAKIVDILAQLLVAGDNVERDAVHKAIMSLLRQDVKIYGELNCGCLLRFVNLHTTQTRISPPPPAPHMAEEPELESQVAATRTKINRKMPKKFREVEGFHAANPAPRTKRYKGALLAVHNPSHCLKTGVGSFQCGGRSLRFQHRTRLFRLLNQLLSRHNWAEASGVLSVLNQATIKDRSLSGNRAKYTATLELLSVINGENLRSRRIQSVYDLWMRKNGSLKSWSTKHKFAVQLELILTCLQRGSMKDAYQAALCLKQERGFDGDPVANLVVGLTFCQLWYSGLPKELQLTELDSSGSYVQWEIPTNDIHMPFEYSKEDNPHEAGGANSVIQCGSSTSVARDKEVSEYNSNQHKNIMDIEAKVKKETSSSSHEPQDLCEKSAEAIGISDSSLSNYSGDLPQVSIFQTQGLPPWLLPLKLPISHESLEDAVHMHRKLLNDDYKSAVKHLRVALHSTPPAIEALHLLIQMLILGDQVDEALHELETLFQSSDTVLQLRLQAGLLEHFDSGNYVKLCTCFEDILKKDPTCSDSLSRLVLMHQRGDYDTHSLVEMIALHLDASYGTCDTWQELASCLLKLSQCEGDRESACNSGSDPDSPGCLDDSNRIPELFTCGDSGNSWRLRSRWWLNRHFHDRILMSEIASGDLKLLSYKAAAASHIYGRHFKYVVKTTETLEKQNDLELHSFLQTHLLNSVGFCTVESTT